MAPVTQYVFAEMLRILEPFPAGRVKTLPYSVLTTFLKQTAKHQATAKNYFLCFWREILFQQKFWKVRNTLCIADFSKRMLRQKIRPKTKRAVFRGTHQFIALFLF